MLLEEVRDANVALILGLLKSDQQGLNLHNTFINGSGVEIITDFSLGIFRVVPCSRLPSRFEDSNLVTTSDSTSSEGFLQICLHTAPLHKTELSHYQDSSVKGGARRHDAGSTQASVRHVHPTDSTPSSAERVTL